MSQHKQITGEFSAPEGLIAALTAEIWLDPDAAESFATDRLQFIKTFADERKYSVPVGFDIDSIQLEESPVGKIDVFTTIEAQTTTATSNCNSYDGSCGPVNSFFCVSHNPGSCPSQNFDCPSQKCTAYPCSNV